MLLLAIDTSGVDTSVAIARDAHVVASLHQASVRRQAEELMPAVDHVCRTTGHRPQDFDVVAVNRGPGRFTGLRVGVATANALRFATGVPVVGVSGLEALAFAAREPGVTLVATVDALKGELFTASYRVGGDQLREVSAPQVLTPDALRRQIDRDDASCLLLGDATRMYRATFGDLRRTRLAADDQFPLTAEAIAAWAFHELSAGRLTGADAVDMLYLRDPAIHKNALR